jgi:NAD-dependent dihydropyrimidine dehydrogenase PreA subunit
MNKTILTGVRPLKISAKKEGGPPFVSYSNGIEEHTVCIGCKDTPCINYKEEEISIHGLASLSFDQTRSTCPTSAISLGANGRTPLIDLGSCINCGVCASRCPTGAIYLSANGQMAVASGSRKSIHPSDECGTNKAAAAFAKTPWTKPHQLNDELIARSFKGLYQKKSQASTARIHNILARNLLIQLGLKASTSRAGDVNNRMDVFATIAGTAIATEVEISKAQIDAPRSVLDSIAVLHSRHKIPYQKIAGLIIVGELPNLRSEFWKVLADVETVLKIKIKVLTTTAAAVLVHNRVKLTTIEDLESANSIRAVFEKGTGRRPALNHGSHSALEAGK